jgi:uncharacterized protein
MYYPTMLVEFSVANYRSILARQTLSMAASSYFNELKDLNTFDMGMEEKVPQLLRSTVLYGPNASGKSTLIQALDFMQDCVLFSQKHLQAGDAINTTPFKLTAAARAADSEFEITFVEKGVRYEYGFSCNAERFTEEWMFAYPNGRAQKWFHRVFDAEAKKDVYKFNSSFEGEGLRKIWQSQTRPNALYFSTAIQLNNAQLMPAFGWFKDRLQVIASASQLGADYTVSRCKVLADKQRIIQFMNAADLSIADLKLKESVFSLGNLPTSMPSALKDEVAREMLGKKITEVQFIHSDLETGAPIVFEEHEESDGTRALFAFAGPWLDVTENELVLVADELDTSLHPLLVHHLVKLLHHSGSKAQLIFTTHDTTLLSQKLLRRDQVWFMEKDETRATRLYPLSDFSPRENEAVERGYLNGRYGGIPFLKELDFYGIG